MRCRSCAQKDFSSSLAHIGKMTKQSQHQATRIPHPATRIQDRDEAPCCLRGSRRSRQVYSHRSHTKRHEFASEGKLEQVQTRVRGGKHGVSSSRSSSMPYSRNRNKTSLIDTTQIPFKTAKRNYMIIDAPGHKEFLKNMITGAANADAAVLVIAANEGVQEQSKRHAYLLSLLGVRQVLRCSQQNGLGGLFEARFREIEDKYRQFLKTLNLEPLVFIPASARFGENITSRSKKMTWHKGPTLAEALDDMPPLRSAGRVTTAVLRAGCLQIRRAQNHRRPY